MKKLLFFLFISIFVSVNAWSECKDGKVPINITTPSGNQKIICVPQTAAENIDNAADHSSGIVMQASCDCWTEKDIEYMSATDPNFLCKGDSSGMVCYFNGVQNLSLVNSLDDSASCRNVDGRKALLGKEEYAACESLIVPYNPDFSK